jgi:phage terminase large subunit-like protein
MIELLDGTTYDPNKENDGPDTSHLWPESELFMPDDEVFVFDDDEEIEFEMRDGLDLDARLNVIDYKHFFTNYRPSQFAIEMVNFIKLVNGSLGEENESPIIHYDMFDQLVAIDSLFHQELFVSFRGSAKTTALHEYVILYLATYGEIPGFGKVNVGMYISDTMENGIKSMRNNLEFRWGSSDFLQKYVPEARFTDIRWYFENADGKKLAFRGFGATTGVRGFKEFGERPVWCGMDDLMSDKNADSPTITKDIKKIVYRAARQALHPAKRMQIWTGTPFNKSDPLYEAAGSGAWNTRTYPICEKFPCKKADFRGGWEDRFPYEFVKREYLSLRASGELPSFNQELMLRITSDEDRLVQESDIVWYNRDKILQHKGRYNFYITTDFGTSDRASADLSVIMVWAYSNNGDWLLVDGLCKRQLMDASINALFKFVSVYRPLEVGIEINGQQQGFIRWIKNTMIDKNIFFNLAGKGSVEGVRRTGRKIDNFKLVVPLFKSKKIWLPIELKNHELVVELVEELKYATNEEFKSKNDDAGDGVSMLLDLEAYKPSASDKSDYVQNEEGTFAWYVDDDADVYKNSTVF